MIQLYTHITVMYIYTGIPDGAVVKSLRANTGDCKRLGFDPWIQKIPWRRKWQPDPVFLLGKFPGQRSLVGYSLWGFKVSDMIKQACARTQTDRQTLLFSHSVMSDSLQPRGLQHSRFSCPSLSSGVCSDSCPRSMMPSNHHILCCPLLLLPSIIPSIRVFSNESALRIRCSKYWSFSISPSNEYSGLISFRIDWFDLLTL